MRKIIDAVLELQRRILHVGDKAGQLLEFVMQSLVMLAVFVGFGLFLGFGSVSLGAPRWVGILIFAVFLLFGVCEIFRPKRKKMEGKNKFQRGRDQDDDKPSNDYN